MKKIMLTLVMMMTIAISASAMTYREARNYARISADKLSYELRLTDRQYREVYDICFRYAGNPVKKDRALSYVLTSRQYDKYLLLHRSPVTARNHHPIAVKAKKHARYAHVPARRTGVYTRW